MRAVGLAGQGILSAWQTLALPYFTPSCNFNNTPTRIATCPLLFFPTFPVQTPTSHLPQTSQPPFHPLQVSEDPPTIRLLFEHTQTDQDAGMDTFYSSSRENRCVVCGEQGHYLRYRIVPQCYRRNMPFALKSHRSHDVRWGALQAVWAWGLAVFQSLGGSFICGSGGSASLLQQLALLVWRWCNWRCCSVVIIISVCCFGCAAYL